MSNFEIVEFLFWIFPSLPKVTNINRFWCSTHEILNYSKEYKKNDNGASKTIDLLFSEATSGQQFSGLPFRTFPSHLRKFSKDMIIQSNRMLRIKWNCTKWGVVTTIFPTPKQEAVRRFLYREDWCVVVVGDKNNPKVQSSTKRIQSLLHLIPFQTRSGISSSGKAG